MKILDRDGRLFGKISIIDVIVILVVAVLALAIYVKTQMPQTGTSVTTTKVVYQMKLNNQPEYMLSAIEIGDELFDKERSTGGSSRSTCSPPSRWETRCTTKSAAPAALWERLWTLRSVPVRSRGSWTTAPWPMCRRRGTMISC